MILKAEPNHLPGIVKLLKANDLPVEDISWEKQSFYMLEENSEILAVCGIERYGSFALLRSLAVKKNLQQQGLGKQIYKTTLTACKSEGISSLFLLTTTATAFFEKLGWSHVSRMAVPKPVQTSEEFKSICPQSADCMMLLLGEPTSKKAFETYDKGSNCAQAVLSAYANELNLPESTAMKLATGLTAGIGYKGNVCGAVLGAYLALGLKYGSASPNDELASESTLFKMREFDREFTQLHGSITCSELLGGNAGKQEELDEIMEKDYFHKACPVFVASSSIILNKLIKDKM